MEEKWKKQQHAAVMREARKRWSDEQKMRNREQSKLRMRKHRKEKAELKAQMPERLTRAEKQKQQESRKKAREYKRKYRAKLSSQKRRRLREKDAARKRQQRQSTKEDVESEPSENELTSDKPSTIVSPEALRKSTYRVKSKLPRSPHKYAKVIAKLINSASPRKRKALEEEHVVRPKETKCADDLVDALRHIVKPIGRRKELRLRRKQIVQGISQHLREKYGSSTTQACHILGIQPRFFTKGCHVTDTKVRKDAVPSEVCDSINKFYLREDVSSSVPNVKAAGDGTSKHVLLGSLNATYQKWQSENPEIRLSACKFGALRPKRVFLQKKQKLLQCLCEYCENVNIKIKALNKIGEKAEPQIKLGDKYNAVAISMCPKMPEEHFHKLNCIDRSCTECGSQIFEGMFANVDVGEVQWNRWELVTHPRDTGKPVKRRELVEKRGSLQDLLQEFTKEVDFLSCHLFQAQWQIKQFATLRENVPPNALVLTMDFAENYTCFAQHEVQGAHWAKTSCTIHPTVALYRCPDDHTIVEETVDVISDDLIHDSHAVNAFLQAIFNHLKKNRDLSILRAYLISDGCAAQYKSKIPFADASYAEQDYGFPIERHYYGSRHGKNRCDGEGGVLKSSASRAVKSSRVMIHNALSLKTYLTTLEKPGINPDGSCCHKRRTILYVPATAINRNRPSRNAKTVPGTQKLHCIIGLSPGRLNIRRLSCFCSHHLGRDDTLQQCPNLQYVGSDKMITLACFLWKCTY